MCYKHPKRDAISECRVCGRPLCVECDIMDGTKHYCFRHLYPSLRKNWRPLDSTMAGLAISKAIGALVGERAASNLPHFPDASELMPVGVLLVPVAWWCHFSVGPNEWDKAATAFFMIGLYLCGVLWVRDLFLLSRNGLTDVDCRLPR